MVLNMAAHLICKIRGSQSEQYQCAQARSMFSMRTLEKASSGRDCIDSTATSSSPPYNINNRNLGQCIKTILKGTTHIDILSGLFNMERFEVRRGLGEPALEFFNLIQQVIQHLCQNRSAISPSKSLLECCLSAI